jgi:hypothetical protein
MLIDAEEAFFAKLANGMYAPLDLLVLDVFNVPMIHGREMDGENIWWIESMLMGEDFFVSYAEITEDYVSQRSLIAVHQRTCVKRTI